MALVMALPCGYKLLRNDSSTLAFRPVRWMRLHYPPQDTFRDVVDRMTDVSRRCPDFLYNVHFADKPIGRVVAVDVLYGTLMDMRLFFTRKGPQSAIYVHNPNPDVLLHFLKASQPVDLEGSGLKNIGNMCLIGSADVECPNATVEAHEFEITPAPDGWRMSRVP